MQGEPLAMAGAAMDVRSLLAPNQHAEDLSEPEPQTTVIVTCPKKMVGRVIGKNGETIKALQNFTGAQIQIDQRIDPTRVSIAGPPKALITANNMVQDIVAGTFKGFAMLRAYANQGSRSNNGFDLLAQQVPVYIKGYGFVPPSQFSSEPSDGFGGMQQYADQFQQPMQANFPGAGYQGGLPTAMLQNPYAAAQVDPQSQYQALALAQAQLIASAQQVPRMIPQMHPMSAASLVPQSGGNYMMPPQTGYGARDQDPNSLAAQLEALNVSDSGVPSNGASNGAKNGQFKNGHTGQTRLQNGMGSNHF